MTAPALLRVVRAGDWPSGLYFLRARAADGRVGYAPFIVRPRRLGTNRVAVVLATNTWAAYNFADADGDGWGDSWYVTGRHRSVDLQRPFLDFGVPFRFHDWDLEFIAWLNRTGRHVDFLSDDDLDAVASGDELARRYDLVVFPGSRGVRDAARVRRDRALPRRSAATSRSSPRTTYTAASTASGPARAAGVWRKLGRPESSVVGVQYVGSDHGQRQARLHRHGRGRGAVGVRGNGPCRRRRVRPLRDRDRCAHGRVAARHPGARAHPRPARPGPLGGDDLLRDARGREGVCGGALNFGASLGRPEVDRLLANVWARLTTP